MKIDAITLQDARKRAIAYLNQPTKTVIKDGVASEVTNEFFTPSVQQTGPVTLRQELPFVNTEQSYVFDFASTAPNPSLILNNRNLPKNNVAAIYAIKLAIGVGDTANNRDYYSHGFTVNDNSIYNSTLSMTIEDQKKIDFFDGSNFLDVYNSPLAKDPLSGLQIIDPVRILSGNMGVWNITLKINTPISALKLTSSLFLSCQLICMMGQASGQPNTK